MKNYIIKVKYEEAENVAKKENQALSVSALACRQLVKMNAGQFSGLAVVYSKNENYLYN